MHRILNWGQSHERRFLLAAWMISLCILSISLVLFRVFQPVTVNFIDVGQGDSCLIRAGANGNVLIDGGDDGQGETLISYLESQNVNSLNAVFISHFHDDHVTGILELMDRNFPIDCFYVSAYPSQTQLEQEFISKATAKSIPVFRLHKNDKITLGKATYFVVNQNPYESEKKLNNMSMLLKVSYHNSSVLLTGDLESDAAKELFPKLQSDVKANILKVPHHGGISSVSEELISYCNPDYAVISVGKNFYGNPSKEMISALTKRNIPIFRTDYDGVISFTLGKNGVKNMSVGKKRR